MSDRTRNTSDILSTISMLGVFFLSFFSSSIDIVSKIALWILPLSTVFFVIIGMIVFRAGKSTFFLDRFLLLISFIIPIMMNFGEVLVPQGYKSLFPFDYYILLAFLIIGNLFMAMKRVENSIYLVLTIPILIVTLGAHLLVILIDIIFPKRFQELVPYIEVTREMILAISKALAAPTRLETESALESLQEVEELVDGYALRKGVGQGIDLGLTFVVFVVGGVLTVMTEDLGIPPAIIAALFASLGLALSTFAGFFGPFYGLAGACKQFSLQQGSYRSAAIYKALEQLFAIPFMAAASAFLLLDLPPVDADSLEDFKTDISDQIENISDNVSSLLGQDAGAVPRKTRKMIEKLMETSENKLSKLDFREMREGTAREFALTYYQYEFSWRPWVRKSAIREFAEKNNFETREGEEILQLIGYKIKAGQMDDDMVTSVMVSAAMKGVIMMEQKYMELFEDAELGQTCTGLAFGARQFMKDHYIVNKRHDRILRGAKNFLIFLFAVPIVLGITFVKWANLFFDKLADELHAGFVEGRIKENFRFRYYEIKEQLMLMPKKMTERKEKEVKPEEETEKTPLGFKIRRIVQKTLSLFWEVLMFPFIILWNLLKWIWYKTLGSEQADPREQFEEAVSHAALVSMYESLYDNLVKQTGVGIY